MIDLNLFNFKSENGINGRKTHNKKKIIRHLSTHKESLAISEIAKVIEFLISDKNTYMSGSGIDINGAQYLSG